MFKASRLKVQRADALIAEFNVKSQEFLKLRPYRLYLHETLTEVYLVGDVQRLVPDELALILGDAMHNLRSSLDVLANDALCKENKKSERKAYFPITIDSVYFENKAVKKQLPGASEKLISFIRAAQPFQENSGSWLRFLHTRDNEDKHQITAPVLGNPSFAEVTAKQIHTGGTIELIGVGLDANVLGPRGIIAIHKAMNIVFDKLPEEHSFFFAFTEDHAKRKMGVEEVYNAMRIEIIQIIEGIEKLYPEQAETNYGDRGRPTANQFPFKWFGW